MSTSNSNTSRHFNNLKRFIALGYLCRDHNQPYSLFHLKRKSLFCSICIDEMDNFMSPMDPNDLFYFDNKEKILTKFLLIFKLKRCQQHEKPYKMFCLYHIDYYCEDCARNTGCNSNAILSLSIDDKKAASRQSAKNKRDNIVHYHNNGKILKKSDSSRGGQVVKKSYSKPNSYGSSISASDIVSPLNGSRNSSDASENDSSYEILIKLEKEEKKKSEDKSYLYSGLDLFKNYKKPNEQTGKDNMKLNIKNNDLAIINENSTCYTFLNSKNLIIFDIKNYFYKKYNLTEKYLNQKNNYYIVEFLASNGLHTDKATNFVFLMKDDSSVLSIFSTNTEKLNEVYKFNTSKETNVNQDNSASYIIKIASDEKVFGLNKKNEFFFYDLKTKIYKSEISEKSLNSFQNLNESFDYNNHSEISSYPSFELSEESNNDSLSSRMSSNYLFIHLVQIKKNGMTFAIFNNNYSKYYLMYKNQNFSFFEFREENEAEEESDSTFSNHFLKKIKSQCKTSFFYFCKKIKRLFYVFIFEDEVCHILIDVDKKRIKLYRSYSLNGLDVCIDKLQGGYGNGVISSGSYASNNYNSNGNLIFDSDLFYINKDSVLIKYCIDSNKFSEYFEFI